MLVSSVPLANCVSAVVGVPEAAAAVLTAATSNFMPLTVTVLAA
ncbi:Uncharacterised protein [Mycobacteroides abscessus subsp. abscessus]|nr:Uncharacterised protein [Mycobacteroides abscessus subsp. abscessus]